MDVGNLRLSLAVLLAAVCGTSSMVSASSAPGPSADEACAPAAEEGTSPGGTRATAAAPALAAHNHERGRLGLPGLAWSCRLEREAAAWAGALARRGQLEHAGPQARGGSGENLWMGTSGRFDIAHMVGRFIEEKRHYRHARFPDISLTGNWADAGHYSQVVWRDTREVGCALAQGPSNDVLVCRYRPAGNVRGRTAY